jgi:hypothetical protein
MFFLLSLECVRKENNYSAGVETAMSRIDPQCSILAAKESNSQTTHCFFLRLFCGVFFGFFGVVLV